MEGEGAGIEGEAPFAWRLARADDGTLYVVVARRSEGNYGSGGDGALYRSRDGAEHWEKVGLPDGPGDAVEEEELLSGKIAICCDEPVYIMVPDLDRHFIREEEPFSGIIVIELAGWRFRG